MQFFFCFYNFLTLKNMWPLDKCVFHVQIQAAKPVYSDSSLDKLWWSSSAWPIECLETNNGSLDLYMKYNFLERPHLLWHFDILQARSVIVYEGSRDRNIGQWNIGDKVQIASNPDSQNKIKSFIILCCLLFSIFKHKFLLFPSNQGRKVLKKHMLYVVKLYPYIPLIRSMGRARFSP